MIIPLVIAFVVRTVLLSVIPYESTTTYSTNNKLYCVNTMRGLDSRRSVFDENIITSINNYIYYLYKIKK